MILPQATNRTCQSCGVEVITTAGNLKLCPKCRKQAEPERRKLYAKRYYRKLRMLRRSRIDATPGKVGGRRVRNASGDPNHAGDESERTKGR